MKVVWSAVGVVLMLLFSGCGEENSTCRIDVQTALDQGRFDEAISLMEGSCSDAYTVSDKAYNLAIAYMGKAGFGVSDVVDMIVNADTNSNDAFVGFTKSVSSSASALSSSYLDIAKSYFLKSAEPTWSSALLNTTTVCSSTNIAGDTRKQNACLYLGFSQALRAASALTTLTGDLAAALQSIESGSGSIPDDMNASINALAWATNNSVDGGVTISDSNVTILGVTYKHLDVNVSGKIFYRLATANAPDTNASTVVTDGYCDVNGDKASCSGIENSDGSIDTTIATGCYACPVLVDGSAQNITDAIVEALNDTLESVTAVTNDPDILQTIDDFKTQIDSDNSGDINATEIIDYLSQ